MNYFKYTLLSLIAGACISTAATAQDFDIHWYTIDGGGISTSTGGDFSLSGTIGQPDAGTLSNDTFTLDGGFWPGMTAGGGDCNGSETISKTKCKTKNGGVKKVIILVKNGTPGDLYTATLDSGELLIKKAKNNGKAKFVFKGNNTPECGANGVTVCDLHKEFNCGC